MRKRPLSFCAEEEPGGLRQKSEVDLEMMGTD